MSKQREGERYCFNVDWQDPQANLVRKYRLLYWPSNSSVELVSRTGQPVCVRVF